MKRILSKNILVFITILFLTACTTTNEKSNESVSSNEVEQPAKDIAEDSSVAKTDDSGIEQEAYNSGGFFWKVEKNDTTVYMLGSTHYATNEYYPLQPDIESAFIESNYLVVEPAITNENNNLIYNDGTTLKDHLPYQLYEDLIAELESYGQSIEEIEKFKPMVVDSILQRLKYEKSGEKSDSGMDKYFLKKASGKEIIPLEDTLFTSNLLSSFSESLQIALLKSTIEVDDEKLSEMNKEFKSAWDRGDLEKLTELSLFLNEAETYFVVVGASHYYQN